MIARRFLEDLQQRMPAESLAESGGKITFDLSGDGGGQYTLVIHETGLLIEDGVHEDADCGLVASVDTFMRVVRREENVLMAMMTGKLKVSNQMAMIRYAQILGLM